MVGLSLIPQWNFTASSEGGSEWPAAGEVSPVTPSSPMDSSACVADIFSCCQLAPATRTTASSVPLGLGSRATLGGGGGEGWKKAFPKCNY